MHKPKYLWRIVALTAALIFLGYAAVAYSRPTLTLESLDRRLTAVEAFLKASTTTTTGATTTTHGGPADYYHGDAGNEHHDDGGR